MEIFTAVPTRTAVKIVSYLFIYLFFQVLEESVNRFWVKHHCHSGSYKNHRDNVCLNDNAPLVDRIGQGHCHVTNLGFRGTVIFLKVNLLIIHITIIQTV